MPKPFLPKHGGQLRELAMRFNLGEDLLLDFSASINPAPPSDKMIDSLCNSLKTHKVVTTYPDAQYLGLRRAIAGYIDVDPACIAIGNGVMPLLASAIHALRISRCMILVPGFTEYRRTLETCGTICHTLALRDENQFRIDCGHIAAQLRTSGAQALLIANPQSPSGLLLSKSQLDQLRNAVVNCGAVMLVDEAYIDYAPHESLSHLAAESRELVVLRSLTKFFSMPGLRVAYSIAHRDTRNDMQAAMPLWPVSSIAAEAAQLAMADTSAIAAALDNNARERDVLADRLRGLGLTVFPSAANYLLMKLDDRQDGAEFWRRLIVEHRIVVRSCANFEGLSPQYLRVCIRNHSDNERLLDALSKMLKS